MLYIISISVLLFSVIVHEVSHGWVAYKCGDSTAKVLGRLTLNPVYHIDIVGTILLPLALVFIGLPAFGWAKPVPINMRNFNNPKRDILYVSAAGVSANILLAVISAILMFFIRNYFANVEIFAYTYISLQYMVIINIVLFVFNLVPVPPLDGSKILLYILPSKWAVQYIKIEKFGFLIIIVLLTTGILWKIIGPIVNFLIKILL